MNEFIKLVKEWKILISLAYLALFIALWIPMGFTHAIGAIVVITFAGAFVAVLVAFLSELMDRTI